MSTFSTLSSKAYTVFLTLFLIELSLAYRTEKLHLFLDGCLYSGCTVGEQLSRGTALALKILACLDILTCCLGKSELALGIYVYL